MNQCAVDNGNQCSLFKYFYSLEREKRKEKTNSLGYQRNPETRHRKATWLNERKSSFNSDTFSATVARKGNTYIALPPVRNTCLSISNTCPRKGKCEKADRIKLRRKLCEQGKQNPAHHTATRVFPPLVGAQYTRFAAWLLWAMFCSKSRYWARQSACHSWSEFIPCSMKEFVTFGNIKIQSQ